MDPAALEAVFRERPAIHRFPGTMAGRIEDLCRHVSAEYGGDASRVWTGATDGRDLESRLRASRGSAR